MTLLAADPGPLWWRVPTWIALTAITVVAADGTPAKIASGVLMGAGWIVLQLVDVPRRAVAATSVVAASGLAIAACFASTGGLAPILACIAAARAPHPLRGGALAGYTVAMAVAFAVAIAVVSQSWLGLFAGTAIPVLVQRTQDHRELVRERDRAQALLAEVRAGREAETQAAALRERGRIAREMHDLLAHSLAGLSVQLQAVRAVAARENVGPAVLDPLDKAAALARDGLTEARNAVGTLRDPVGLGLDSIDALVARHPGTATLTVEGEPGAVSPAAGHAVYRAVQESLTNAARHAPGTTVAVTMSWTPHSLDVTVLDSGPAPGRDALGVPSTGLGLAGMSERLDEVGGRVEAGPRGAGWRVCVTVPVGEAP